MPPKLNEGVERRCSSAGVSDFSGKSCNSCTKSKFKLNAGRDRRDERLTTRMAWCAWRMALSLKATPGICDERSFWLQSMMAGFPASYFCIKAFSETDLTEDLKRIDVPTLVLHGDDDQIVPYADSALISSKIIENAKLVIYKGAPHGMCTTLKDRVNEELLAFIKN